jgi:hypothetical protein
MTINTKQIFNSSWGTLPPHFVGRLQEISDIKQMTMNGQTVPLLVGRRGVGKTCLIRKVLEELEREGWIVEPPDWATTPDRSMTPSEAATLIIDAAISYKRKVTPPTHHDQSPRPIGFLNDNENPEISEDTESFSDFAPTDLCKQLEEMGTRRAGRFVSELLKKIVVPTPTHCGLLVIIDELHMQGVDSTESPIGMLAQIISQCREHQIPVRFILAGMPLAAVHLEKCLGGGIDLIHTIKVGHFTLAETQEAISRPLAAVNKKFDELLIQRIHVDTDGHPKLVQFFAQSMISLCRDVDIYSLAQYREIASKIEELYYRKHYHEVLNLPEKRLDALWAMARASEWRAEHDHKSPEQICVSPRDIMQFSSIQPSYLDRQLGILMEPGGDYIYKADRALYGFLKPLLWKYLLRWRGEQALVSTFGSTSKFEIDPHNFDNPAKARVQLKHFITEATRTSQRVWIIDEYLKEQCVTAYLEAVCSFTDIYLVTRLEPYGPNWNRFKQALAELRAARKGRIKIANFEGISSGFPVKGRFIICSHDTGIESSQSFADIGERLSTVSMLSRQQISVLLDTLEKYDSRFVEM